MKKLLVAALTAALVSPVFAATQYLVVVPIQGRAAAPISVSLSNAALPAAETGVPYAGYDLKTHLSVSGDAGFTGSGVTWSVASGSIPAGLALNADGTLSGTPTASSNTYNFSVAARYKGVTGVGAYSLAVKSAASASLVPNGQASTVIPTTGVNDYTALWLVLTNTGSVPLTIQGLRSSGAPFSLVNRGRLPTSIAPGAVANLNVLFQPTAPGSYSGTVTATTEAGQVTLAVSGDAVYELPPSVDKTALDFGTVAYGSSSSPQVVTVKNVSSVPMGIRGITLTTQDTSVPWTSEFVMPGLTCFTGSWIPPGETCSVPVVYAPQSDPNPAFNLTITTPGGTKVIPVTGKAR
ncbi:choice-of-anchor D domain-containing protein [Burkholderia ubonensis]|uniref:choice-of-anchor D domain-containing protein n=1 Tax=Burkholderia ubonensis TaxID=101571 RepID=UPI0009B34ED0|nr:choice-of-anchor D domain-containing protein [Burkholderia ubonensis]